MAARPLMPPEPHQQPGDAHHVHHHPLQAPDQAPPHLHGLQPLHQDQHEQLHHHRRLPGASTPGAWARGARVEAAFRWSVVLNAGLTALQLSIGIGFGSLALIGDALHNLGDVVGLALGWGAERLSRKPAVGRFTYGYGRSTHLAALINGVLVFAAGAVVVVEAVERLLEPVPLQAGPVAAAAGAGVVINLISARLFGHDHGHDLNQRAAVLHLLTDAAVSLAVLVSAVAVGLTGWHRLDAMTAIAVGLVVMSSSLALLREAIAVTLDAAPRGVDVEAVRAALLALPGVAAVPELHVWSVSSSRIALTAHLLRHPARGDALNAGLAQNAFLAQAERRLAELGIRKSTLQVEEIEAGG